MRYACTPAIPSRDKRPFLAFPCPLARMRATPGMTLDAVEVDLSRVFEYGQAYVALSRARTYEGLCVKGFTSQSLKAHPAVLDFYTRLFPSHLTMS